MYRKEIVYDRETRDFAMYLDGELVGFARTYHQGECDLNDMVLDLLQQGLIDSTADLTPQVVYVTYDPVIRRFICRWRQDDSDSGGYVSCPDFASCQKHAAQMHMPVLCADLSEVVQWPR